MNPEDHRRSCPGFLDEYGNWNNGFDCSTLSGQIRVCCGTESRRYCCSIENFQTNPMKYSLSTNKTNLSFIEKINITFLTLPILFTCFLVIILFLLFILIILSICYCYRQRHNTEQIEHLSTKQTIQVEHFPFSPPHHQIVFNENPIPQLMTTSSSTLARLPSDIYSNEWKEFSSPTISSSQHYDRSYLYSNYLIHGKYPQQDILV